MSIYQLRPAVLDLIPRGDRGVPGTPGDFDYASMMAAAGEAIPVIRQTLRTGGYSDPSGEGSALYHRVAVEPSHAGKFQSMDGGWWELSDQNWDVKMFGATGKNIADDTAALEAAMSFVSTRNHGGQLGGTLYIPPGKYAGNLISAQPNVKMIGAGNGATMFYLNSDNKKLMSISGANGWVHIEGITFYGYGDRNPSQGSGTGDTASIMVHINGADRVTIRDCYAMYSRHMSILVEECNRVWIEDNFVQYSYRDAINTKGSKFKTISGNHVLYCGDDAIGAHDHMDIGSDTAGFDVGTVISHNVIRFSGGIRAVGGRNINISDNALRFISYTFIGVIYAPPEGLTDKQGVIIANNTCIDLINARYVTNEVQIFARGILVQPMPPTVGTGAHTRVVPPGQWHQSLAGYVKPETAYWNQYGGDPSSDAWARGSSMGISITGNVLMNTLKSAVAQAFSAFGFGQLWGNQGFVDPSMTGTIFGNNGGDAFSLFYSAVNMKISDNTVIGFTNGVITGAGMRFIQNLKITDNLFFRTLVCVNLAIDTPTTTLRTDSEIRGNTFDCDPYFEHADRELDGSLLPTGAWLNTGTASGHPVVLNTTTGTVITSNTMRNCKRPVHMSAVGQCLSYANVYYGDPSNHKGMDSFYDIQKNNLIWVDSDPRNATFGNVLSAPDRPVGLNAVPSTGYWMAGQYVPFTSPFKTAQNMIAIGAIRLTTGGGNAIGTDWERCYTSTVSPAV